MPRRSARALLIAAASIGSGLGASSLAAQDLRVIPAPRDVIQSSTPHRLSATIAFETLGSTPADRAAAEDFAEAMRERRLSVSLAPLDQAWTVHLLRTGSPAATTFLRGHQLAFESVMIAEGYVLHTDARGATIVAASDAGMFYGLQTLRQLITGAGNQAKLVPVTLRDWPAMRWRGVHDDLSRGPMPTLEYQKRQVRLFSAYKINLYSPYFEHTLAFKSHPLIAPPGGAMTREEVRELVAYAARRHVTIVPEQQTFGHLHHALKLELYAPLAETPHGHVLAPGQRASLALARDLFAEIDSLFPGPFLHLGADETFELGKGQTKPRVDSLGLGPVYAAYVRDIEEALRRPGKQFLFWGDIAIRDTAQIRTLPKHLIAVAWEYAAASRFDRLLKPFRDAGMETWVAPGVSNWNRVYPNFFVALPNIQGFAREGQASGATGFMNTSWDDFGDAIFEQTWYGILFGASAGWQAGEASIPQFETAFALQFHGDTARHLDAAQRHLAAGHALLTETRAGDASTYLFFVDPFSDEGVFDLIRLRPVLSAVRIQAESALIHIAAAREQSHLREKSAVDAMELGARRMDWLAAKFQFADEIAIAFTKATDPTRTDITWQDMAELSGINGRLQDMRDGYVLTRELFERSWHAENRPYWLQNNLARFDLEIGNWVRRIAAMDRARRRFARDRKLPTAAEIEIPAALLAAPAVPTTAPANGRRPRR
jgi:hexosaminidase